MIATQRLVRVARETGARVHVLHISTAQEMDFLRDHKDVASVEVTPHHLTLVAPECYERLGTLAQMNPPVRDAAHRAALWQALEQGVVDVLGSDHAPHTFEEKAKAYPASPSGMTGVQTLVPLMLDHVSAVDAAVRLRCAIETTIAQDNVRTRDLGGGASTAEFARAVARRL